jgi:hypothetical protein
MQRPHEGRVSFVVSHGAQLCLRQRIWTMSEYSGGIALRSDFVVASTFALHSLCPNVSSSATARCTYRFSCDKLSIDYGPRFTTISGSCKSFGVHAVCRVRATHVYHRLPSIKY